MELVYSGKIFDYDENFTSVMVMKSDLGDEDTWAIYDMFSAMVTSYFEIAFMPTFLIN